MKKHLFFLSAVHSFFTKNTKYCMLIAVFTTAPLLVNANEAFNRWVNLTQEISATPADNNYAEYALSGNTIHIVWLEYKYGETANLYYRRSTDKGGTWEASKKLFTFAAKSSLPVQGGYSRMLSVEGSSVHIAFSDYEYSNNGTGKLYYLRSTDGGGSFGEAQELANTGGGYTGIPHSLIRSSGNNIAIAYQNNTSTASRKGIRVAYSTNNGQTFADTLAVPYSPLTTDLTDFYYNGQQMIFLHNYLYYMYGFNTGKTYVTVSNDNGANFATHKLSRTFMDGQYEYERSCFRNKSAYGYYYYMPHIASSDGVIHIVFSEYKSNGSSTTWRPVYVRSTDGGLSFEEPVEFSDMDQGESPVIAAKGGKVYVACHILNKNILVKTSSGNGAAFTPAANHFQGRYPYGLDVSSNYYSLLIDPNDASGSTVHLVGDRQMLATSVNAGESFDYFMGCNNRSWASNKMITDMLVDNAGVKHFFNATHEASNSDYMDILYNKTGAEPEPDGTNRAFRIKEADNIRTDNTALIIPGSPSLAFESALTVEVWVKFDPQQTSSSPIILRNKEGNYYADTPNGFQIGANVSYGNVELHSGIQTDNGRFFHYSPEKITDTLWHHVALTYDANGGLNNFILYVDGIVKNRQTVVGKIDAGNGITMLGRDYSSTWKFDFQTDEVRLWNRALTQEELRANMIRKEFENEPALKLYLNFDNTLKDLSGNGNDAVAMGVVKLETSNLNPPAADFDLYKTLDEVWLNDKTLNGSVAKWDLGNNTGSTQQNPKYKYPNAGEYEITLLAKNDNSITSASQSVSIAGLDRISPVKAGNRNYVTLDVYGGGLSAQNTTVLLRKAGEADITGASVTEVNPGFIQARLPLDNAATGVWDVVVKKGAAEQILPKTFTIEEAKEALPWVSIEGRNAVLLNRFQTYTINYGNKGNIDAHMVPLWLIVSDHDELDVVFFDFDMVLPEHYENHKDAGLVKEAAGIYFTTDMVDGVPMNARVYPLMLPVIRANSNGSLRIRVKSPEDYELKASINGPWGVYEDENSSPAVGKSDIQDASRGIDLSKAECMVQIMGRGVIDATSSVIPAAGCIWGAYKIGDMAYQHASGNSKQSVWNTLWNVGLSAVDCGASLAKDLAFPVKFGIFVVNLANAAYDMRQCLEPRSDDDKKIRTVSSFDPNEMVGPGGFGEENWIPDRIEMPYTILFENKNTATAPAHEVVINDTLDAERFDLSRFSFGTYGWGDTIIVQTESAVWEFSREIDLRPVKNTIVRISGKLDTLTATVKWDFRSLDPETMHEQEDPFLGFLPPNGEQHEGEGFVSFTVGLKPVTETGTSVSNKATIVFDANEPIITNEYINTFDLTPPQSQVLTAQAAKGDSILVSWSGSDMGSGIKEYNIWVQKDNGETKPLFIKTPEASGKFKGEYGSTYKFYSIASDNAFLTEEPPSDFEAQLHYINVEDTGQTDGEWHIYPILAKDKLNIQMKNASFAGDYVMEIIGMNGTKHISKIFEAQQIREGIILPITGLPTGLYLLHIMYGERSVSEKFMVE